MVEHFWVGVSVRTQVIESGGGDGSLSSYEVGREAAFPRNHQSWHRFAK